MRQVQRLVEAPAVEQTRGVETKLLASAVAEPEPGPREL